MGAKARPGHVGDHEAGKEAVEKKGGRLLDRWGGQVRHLPGVMIEMTKAELAPYAVECVVVEERDDEVGDSVHVEDAGFVERSTWHKIPAAHLAGRCRVQEAY